MSIEKNILNETMEHFKLSGFKTYRVNGMEVVDLTSVDKKNEPIKLRGDDIERQKIYDVDKAWSKNWL